MKAGAGHAKIKKDELGEDENNKPENDSQSQDWAKGR